MPGKKTMKQAKKLGIKGTGYKAGKKIPKKKNREETLQKYYSGLMDVAKQKAEAKKNNKKIVKKQVGGLARGPGIKAGGKVPSYNELVTAKLMKKGGKIK